MYSIEKATMADVPAIQKLINGYARKSQMLQRSLQALYENMRSFVICRNTRGTVIGCCAIQIVWEDLAEVRSLAVAKAYWKKGIGAILVKACIAEAEELGIKKIFTLTYSPDFFKKVGFKKVSKKSLPHKIWNDCINCPQFPDCDETAMLRVLN